MTSQILKTLFAVFLACSLVAGSAVAQDNGNGNGHGNGKAKGHNKHKHDDDDDDQGYQRYGFRQQDREVVTTYYSKHGSHVPPGQAKRAGDLPPGLEKQLERKGTLPPGLQKKLQPCPVEITRELPPLPPDYQRSVIGAHIVVFNRNTNIIVDVMKDVAY